MKISVIFCTLNRAKCILPCLNSIARALSRASPLDCEILVIDNGSSDDTVPQIEEWAKSVDVPTKVVVEPKRGTSKARNRGLKEATGDLFIFTDDDCRLDENYIVEIIRLASSDTIPVLRGGKVELGDPDDLAVTILTQDYAERWHKTSFIRRHRKLSGSVFGCNMAFHRSIAEKVGYFDERFGPGSGLHGAEDSDYAVRAYLAGIPVEYNPAIKVFHFHGRRDPQEMRRHVQKYAIGNGALFMKYLFIAPTMCRGIPKNFKNMIMEKLSPKNIPQDDGRRCISPGETLLYNFKGMLQYLRVASQPTYQND